MSDTGNLVYNRQVALILGICGVMIGVLCIFVQIPAYTEEYEFWSLFSPGIWTAVFVSWPQVIPVTVKSQLYIITNRYITLFPF